MRVDGVWLTVGEYDTALTKCSKMIEVEEGKTKSRAAAPGEWDVYTLPYTLKANVLTQKAMLMMQSGLRPTAEIEVGGV